MPLRFPIFPTISANPVLHNDIIVMHLELPAVEQSMKPTSVAFCVQSIRKLQCRSHVHRWCWLFRAHWVVYGLLHQICNVTARRVAKVKTWPFTILKASEQTARMFKLLWNWTSPSITIHNAAFHRHAALPHQFCVTAGSRMKLTMFIWHSVGW